MAMTLFWEMKNMMSFLIMMFMMNAFHTAAGVLISKTNTTACQGSTANIDFDINLQGSTLGAGSESWYFGSTQIATKPNGSFAPQGNYSSRLSSYSTYGMSLNNTKYTDAGEYSLVFFVTSPTLLIITANASLTVYVAQTNSCVPSYTLTGKTATCFLNQTAISSNECGLPVLQTNWTIGSGTSNSTTVEISGNFTCCAYGIARNCYSGSYTFCETFPITVSSTTSTGTTTPNTTTVTSSSTSMSSTTSTVIIGNTSTKPTTNGSASTTISTSSNITIGNISVTPVTNGSASATNNTSTSTKPTLSESPTINNTLTKPTISGSTAINNTTSNKSKSDIDIKVIVPAVVVPCGLLIIGGIILVVCCVRRRTEKNVRESPDGMAVQDKGNNIDEWKQAQGHGKATDNLDAVYTTPDGFVIFPGPAAMSSVRSYKKHHDGTDQYNRPYAGPYHHQAEYFPSTYTSAGAYTHKDKKHHGVTDHYSRPSAGAYGYQTAHVPITYKSARTYSHKGRNYDYEGPIHQQASRLMATSRPAYDQTAYYPQTGHYGQSSRDVYYSGGGQYSYGQRSRSHYDYSGRKQQRKYYNQYEMADYGGSIAGYRHTKQDTAFYY